VTRATKVPPAAAAEFTWERPASGRFRTVEAPDLGGPLLIDAGLKRSSYRPLAEFPGLFLEFAHLPAPDAACIDFANRYGRLGLPTWAPAADPGWEWYDREPDVPWGRAEPLAEWHRLSARMIDLVLRWEIYRIPPDAPIAPGPGAREESAEALREGLNTELQASVERGLFWDAGRGALALRDRPRSLWGAMCLQLAQAVAGDTHWRRCAGCGRWFELAPGLKKASAFVCSPACRSLAYRGRKLAARRLAAAGVPAAQIARELGSSAATVRGWLRAGQKGE
jgi:hypothetical protein